MKNCKTCNAVLEDTAVFCVMCGAKMEGEANTNIVAPPEPSNIDYATVLTGESAKDSPRQVFFNTMSSSKALTAVILLTITFMVSLVSVIISLFTLSSGSFNNELMAELLATGSIDSGLAKALIDGVTIGINVMIVAMLIPSSLTVVGIIFTYLNSKKRSLSTAGLTCIKMMSVITLVYYGLIFVLLVIASLGIPYGFIGVVLASAIGFALPVVIQIVFLTTTDKMKKVVQYDGNLTIPTFVPVIIIIGCGISALMGLTSGDFLSMIIGGVGVVGNVFLAICLFDYNNSLALLRVKNIYDKPVDRGNGL